MALGRWPICHRLMAHLPTVHRPMGEGFPSPFVLADIELDEGWRMYSRLINCNPEEIAIGLEVEVIFEKFMDRTLPFFQARNEIK